MLLKNCKALLPEGLMDCSILLSDGKITDISVTPSRMDAVGEQVFDVAGKLVLPGAIDPHVHVREPGATQKEDWRTASMAAAHGGVTTMLDMPNNSPPTATVSALREKLKLAHDKSIINYGAHIALMPGAEIAQGAQVACSGKLYLASTTGNLLVDKDAIQKQLMTEARRAGLLVCVHAEDESMNTPAQEPMAHAAGRPAASELSGVRRAVAMAKSCKAQLHCCHLTTAGSVSLVAAAGEMGAVTCEATPHHLHLDLSDLERLGPYGKMNPPLRSKQEREGLLGSLGKVTCIATDHAPHMHDEKQSDGAPSGVPGLDHYFPAVLALMHRDVISLDDVWRLTSAGAALRWGFFDKGVLAVGADADIAVLEPKQETDLGELYTKCGWTPMVGKQLHGRVAVTIAGGTVAYDGEPDTRCRGRQVLREGAGEEND